MLAVARDYVAADGVAERIRGLLHRDCRLLRDCLRIPVRLSGTPHERHATGLGLTVGKRVFIRSDLTQRTLFKSEVHRPIRDDSPRLLGRGRWGETEKVKAFSNHRARRRMILSEARQRRKQQCGDQKAGESRKNPPEAEL